MSHTSISANLVLCDKSLSAGADGRTASLLTAGPVLYHRSSQAASLGRQEQVGARPGLSVAPPISKMVVPVPGLALCIQHCWVFGLTSKYQPGIRVQKLGVIKHALTGRTCLPAGGKQKQFS